MFTRFAFLITMILGLAVGQVRAFGTCAITAGEPACQSCCADPATSCCVNSATPQPPASPAQTAPSTSDVKQLVSPTLILLSGVAPPVAEPPFVHRQHTARIPVMPVLARTCIQLV